jgi:hypothetical protein
MQRIFTVAKYQVEGVDQHLLIAANKDWVECDKLTHAWAWKTIKSGSVFFSSGLISKQ